MPYVLYIKGNSYFAQITDTTRDQQISMDAINTYQMIINNYPQSEYAKDAQEKLKIGVDQLAGKEMSVGRYYLGNGNYPAAINRFRVVAENYQNSTHIEEALYRLDRSQPAARPHLRSADGRRRARAQLSGERVVQARLRAAAPSRA